MALCPFKGTGDQGWGGGETASLWCKKEGVAGSTQLANSALSDTASAIHSLSLTGVLLLRCCAVLMLLLL